MRVAPVVAGDVREDYQGYTVIWTIQLELLERVSPTFQPSRTQTNLLHSLTDPVQPFHSIFALDHGLTLDICNQSLRTCYDYLCYLYSLGLGVRIRTNWHEFKFGTNSLEFGANFYKLSL